MHLAGRNFLRCVEGRENSLLTVTVINDSGGSLLPSTTYISLVCDSSWQTLSMLLESPGTVDMIHLILQVV